MSHVGAFLTWLPETQWAPLVPLVESPAGRRAALMSLAVHRAELAAAGLRREVSESRWPAVLDSAGTQGVAGLVAFAASLVLHLRGA